MICLKQQTDRGLYQVILHGEFALQGFRNRDLRQALGSLKYTAQIRRKPNAND
jgi:hypothetical protein